MNQTEFVQHVVLRQHSDTTCWCGCIGVRVRQVIFRTGEVPRQCWFSVRHQAKCRYTPGQVVDADSMFCFRVFRVHLDAERLVHQEDKRDGSRVRLHVQKKGVLHHQPSGGIETAQIIHLHQACPKSGPGANHGPRSDFIRPAASVL